jgi:hypothetical protein
MLDVSHIPGSTNSTQIFYAAGATTWQTWQKPRGAKFIQIFCLGGGGGGAGGGLNIAVTTINAGSGGAGAGYSRCIYPTFLLPDTLYVQVGLGGVAGTGSAANNSNGQGGGSGGISYVAITPSTTTSAIIAQSMNVVSPGGNGNGNTTTASQPAAWVFTSNAFAALGIISTTLGIAGVAQNSIGTTALTASLITQGVGGGSKPSNSQNAGGSIFSASVILTNTLPGGVAGGGNGQNGYGSMSPFCGTGGSGGGGNLTGPGGRGGDGYYGCGGGGGGAGFSGSIGGRGGKGGDGLVIITTIF